MEHIRFIINPKSGQTRKKKVPELIENCLDHSKFTYDIKYTQYRRHAVELTKEAINDGVQIVCAVGGDGSVHEVGVTLINSGLKLAIIPTGSGNGLARHLKIPLKIKKSIDCLNSNVSAKIDTVSLNNKPFLGVAGMGLDAVIADKFDTHKTRGFTGYISIVFKEYFKFKPIKVQYTIDDITRIDELFICSIANSSEFGNGFKISPKSKINDGVLELFKLKKVAFLYLPIVAYRFFSKSIHKSKYVDIIPFKTMTVNCSTEVMHVDGEPINVKSPLEIKIIPKSLNILVGNIN